MSYKATSSNIYIYKNGGYRHIKDIRFEYPIKTGAEFFAHLEYKSNPQDILALAKKEVVFKRFASPTNPSPEVAIAYKKYIMIVTFRIEYPPKYESSF
jgi:hypothetical protein